MTNFKGKVAVVTGGNSGIGYATARRLKASGAEVIITGRSSEKVSKAAAELGVTGVVADASRIEQTAQLVEEIKALHGSIDVLFVNAGIFLMEPVGRISESTFDQLMGINFKGAVFTIEKFLPLLKEGGSIISLSSVVAQFSRDNIAIYAASKAALNTYTKTVAGAVAPRKIRVNIISPGPIATPIFDKTGLPEAHAEQVKEGLKASVPLKQLGDPEDIANAVLFLASDQSKFITGTELFVDGGALIHA